MNLFTPYLLYNWDGLSYNWELKHIFWENILKFQYIKEMNKWADMLIDKSKNNGGDSDIHK